MKILRVIVSACLIIPAIFILFYRPHSDSTDEQGRVVVDYWEKWTDAEGRSLQQMVDQFNRTVGKEKNIYVRCVTTSAIEQKTLIATAAGVPPDVAGLYDGNLAQYAAQSALTPLEGMAAAHGITEGYYKKVYWDACHYHGHLYALISTPMSTALFYNTDQFRDTADKLRAAGLDPTRAPRTIAELDAYAKVLDIIEPSGQIDRTGYLPVEPGWYINTTYMYFGGQLWNPATSQLTLTDRGVVDSYAWIGSYATRLGRGQMTTFHSASGNFDSPQNPFMAGTVSMEEQGPWMANFFYNRKPSMSTVLWSKDEEMTKPLSERRKNYTWATAAFPSVSADLKDVAYCGFDTLVIPRGAKHPKEAFEFIAYMNRPDVSEQLCKLHCKNSPLAKVSDDFLNHHPNPYIDVFERLASSPNAQALPQIPIWPEVAEELNDAAQKVTQNGADPEKTLAEKQVVLQAKLDLYMDKQRARQAAGTVYGN